MKTKEYISKRIIKKTREEKKIIKDKDILYIIFMINIFKIK